MVFVKKGGTRVRNALTIGTYTLLRHLRDIRAMLVFTLLPLCLILILGTALQFEFTPKTIGPFNVGLYTEDRGPAAAAFEQMLTSGELETMLDIRRVKGEEEGVALVRSGELDTFIHLPADFSEQIQTGGKAQIEIHRYDEVAYVEPIIEGFARHLHFLDVMRQMGGAASPVPAPEGGAGLAAPPDGLQPMIEEVKMVTEGKTPRGLDYYAIATLLQSLLIGSIFGVFAVTKDQGNHTWLRLHAAPVGSFQVTLGKLLGSALTMYAISLIIFLVTKYAFRANWDGDLGVILLVLFLFSLTAAAIGMFFAYLTKSTLVAAIILFFLSTLFTLVSGGFSHLVDGPVIDTLSRFAPSSYAQQALFATIYEGVIPQGQLGGLCLYALIAVTLAFVAGRRRMA
jgi:ABC-2 type transport system permease protein